MAQIDLRKLALRLKITEMLAIHAKHRMMEEAHEYWRRMIQPN